MEVSKNAEKLTEAIERMVMWGAEESEVFEKLEINGITGEPAKALYRQARAARVAVIRLEALRKIRVGLLWLLGGVGFHLACWYGLGFTLFRLIWLAVIYGFWKAGSGLVEFLFAHRKGGSVADED